MGNKRYVVEGRAGCTCGSMTQDVRVADGMNGRDMEAQVVMWGATRVETNRARP